MTAQLLITGSTAPPRDKPQCWCALSASPLPPLQAESNFVGKGVLLQWLNNTLELKLDRIEDVSAATAAGSA